MAQKIKYPSACTGIVHVFRLFFSPFGNGSEDKVSVCNAGDLSSVSGLGRSPGEGNGNLPAPAPADPGNSNGRRRQRVHWL